MAICHKRDEDIEGLKDKGEDMTKIEQLTKVVSGGEEIPAGGWRGGEEIPKGGFRGGEEIPAGGWRAE